MAVAPITVNNITTGEFPERRVIVKLVKSGADGKDTEIFINKESNLVDVKVRLTRNYGGIDPQAQVSILNLSPEHIANFMTYQFNPDNPNKIFVYAGYETKGKTTSQIPFLFTGNIIWAIPTSGRPDVWFTMNCVENFFAINDYISFNGKKGDTPLDLMRIALLPASRAENFSLNINFPINTSKLDELKKYSDDRWNKYQTLESPENYSFNGTLGAFISTEPYQWNKMQISIMNGEVWVLPNSDDMNFLTTAAQPQYVISASSKYPMIDIPKPNPTGVDVVTLFNRELVPNTFFKLDSEFFSAFNRLYWIQRVVYDLHLRGQNFYNLITARR